MKIIEHLTLDEERALYGVRNAVIRNCLFDGPADGESALKECRDIQVDHCKFHLRYPFWHVENADVQYIEMTETCRAAMWYDRGLRVSHSTLGGIKAFREMDGCSLADCKIISKEFGWFCQDLKVERTTLESEYPFFQCSNVNIDELTMTGKYSFQYCTNVEIHNSNLNTKDAFWHAKNVTVYDSVIRGEYLGWYSENLRLVNCRIIGTQPLCYCKNLVLENCEMVDCDLSFENSVVHATIRGKVESVKNPAGGEIVADAIGTTILDEYQWNPGATRISIREHT